MSLPAIETQQHHIESVVPPLRHGERLAQPEFHRRYEAMPADVRAELVGGIVYIMSSLVYMDHSEPQAECAGWLLQFKAACPAVRVLDNTSVILGISGEPQPDLCLRILEEYGGASRRNEKGCLVGPPELVLEVAVSSAGYDLVRKKRDYETTGVREYVVVLPAERQVVWFVLENGRYEELPPADDGILRSRIFPGLWLYPEELLQGDTAAVSATVAQGLASVEHREWVANLPIPPDPDP